MMLAMDTHQEKNGEVKKVRVLLANDIIVIQNGVITNNPFIFRLEKSLTSQWMIANRKKVIGRIKFLFREYYGEGYGGNIDDCFGYAVEYFMKSKRRAFRRMYFGQESTYDVQQYCFSQLKYIVRNYLKDINGKLVVQPIVNADEKESSRGGMVDETLAIDQMCVEDKVLVRDIKMWDEQFEWLRDYESYFKDKNYKDFDIMGYLAYMYFDVQEDIETHANHVAKMIGESVELIALVTSDFKEDVSRQEDRAIELLTDIKELVQASKHGWKPKVLRDKR